MKFRELPLRNLVRKPGRTWALILLTAFLSLSVFGGSMVVASLRSGLNSLEARLGADVIVLPREAKTKLNFENILLQGTTSAFYMDAGLMDRISVIEGVDKVAPQTFLASLKADCCSSKVQVIGVDMGKDFIVRPWIEQSYSRELDFKDVVVGCNINAGVGDNIRIYNVSLPVVAQLAETGTGLDTAVYCGMDTMKLLLGAAEEMGVSHKVTADSADNVVSAIYVKVQPGYDVEKVADQVNSHPLWKVTALQTKNMITDVSSGLAGVSSTVGILIAAVWALAFIILLIAFAMLIRERKREFAVLRLIGTSRRMLGRMVLGEGAMVSLLGGLLGIALGAVLVFPFTGLIEAKLGLPYLSPGADAVLLVAALALVCTALVGSLASAYAAFRLSRVDTGTILREGN